MKSWKQMYLGLCVLAGGVALGGCAVFGPVADPTRFFILDVPEYSPVSEGNREGFVVEVSRIQVARYLDAPGITIREGENRLYHSERFRWAESIEHGVSRLVTEHLRQEPVVSNVTLRAGQRGELPDYELHISIIRAEGVQQWGSHAVFHANWELRGGRDGAVAARGQVRESDLPWNGEDFAQLAGSLSQGVVEMSHQVARALDGLRR